MHINKDSEVFIISIILATCYIELKSGALKLLQNELRDGTIPRAVKNGILTDQHLYVKPKVFQIISKQNKFGRKMDKYFLFVYS